MKFETLVHTCHLEIQDDRYEVLIYVRGDGRHVAKTVFSPEDIIINDGITLDEVLAKHQRLLPLAINSRRILKGLQPRPEPS